MVVLRVLVVLVRKGCRHAPRHVPERCGIEISAGAIAEGSRPGGRLGPIRDRVMVVMQGLSAVERRGRRMIA